MKRFFIALFLIFGFIGIANATVPSATPLKNTYNCNSSTTQWSYGFPISATSDMTVYITDSTGTTTQILTNFSVDTNNLWVVYPVSGTACATGNQITLIPSTPQTQLLSLTARSPFVATAIGGALDKLTLISQQLQGQLNRTILGPVNGSGQTTLPAASDGNVIGWSGGSLVNFVPNTNTYITTSTDGTFASDSDSLIPTQKATKTYVDTGLATKVSAGANSSITSLTGLLTPLTTGQGGTGASANANAANGVVILNGSGQIPALSGVNLTAIPLVSQTALPYVKCSNQQTSGTGGGTASTSTWTNQVLNTKDNDTGSIASLASNKVTLPAGSYRVTASSPFRSTVSAQVRIYNVTDSAVLVWGQSGLNLANSAAISAFATVSGYFTISGSKDIAVQYYVNTSNGTTDLGYPTSAGQEVYTVVEFTKIQ